jgi:hypothetical protein
MPALWASMNWEMIQIFFLNPKPETNKILPCPEAFAISIRKFLTPINV